MYNYPNRAESREVRLICLAEKGKFSYENAFLYPGEIKKLEKEGFVVSDIKPTKDKGLYTATIDWGYAYRNGGIPCIVYSYIHDIIMTFPESHVKNFSQRLYIISSKAIRKLK